MGRQLRLRIIDPKIGLSPLRYDASSIELQKSLEGDDDVVFVLGSSAYNSLTKHHLQNPAYPYEFRRDGAKKLVLMARSGGEVEGRPFKELGIIQRITQRPNGKVTFLCAGIGTSATLGCVQYLVAHWRKIHRTCGNKDFVICLEFVGQSPDSESVTIPKVVPGGFILMA